MIIIKFLHRFSVLFPRLRRILVAQWWRSVASLTIIPTNQITVIVMLPWKQKPDNRENYFVNNIYLSFVLYHCYQIYNIVCWQIITTASVRVGTGELLMN
jgi:hypothetical protein